MRRRVFMGSCLVLATFIHGPATLCQVSPLVLVDANDQIVGDVLAVKEPRFGTSADVVYWLGSGEQDWVVLEFFAFGPAFNPPDFQLYYELPACQGTGYAVTSPGFSLSQVGFVWNSRIYQADPLAPDTTRTMVSASPGPPNCLAVNETGDYFRAVADRGPFIQIAPYRLIRNPYLFSDTFERGDMSRWSNY